MDTLQWSAHFHDTGCQYSPTCQTCPLPKCKHEMSREERARLQGSTQRAKVMAAYQRVRQSNPGLPNARLIELAAAEAGVVNRTVYRALEAASPVA